MRSGFNYHNPNKDTKGTGIRIHSFITHAPNVGALADYGRDLLSQMDKEPLAAQVAGSSPNIFRQIFKTLCMPQ